MIETQHTLLSNVSQAYANPLAGSYFMTAEMYLQAATQLPSPGNDIPRLLLLLFGLEIAMKAYLLDKGKAERTLKHHDLRKLYRETKDAGLPIPGIEPVIDDYADDHKDHSFRYGKRDYVDLKDPARAWLMIKAGVDLVGRALRRNL
jgi:hypothetical protein